MKRIKLIAKTFSYVTLITSILIGGIFVSVQIVELIDALIWWKDLDEGIKTIMGMTIFGVLAITYMFVTFIEEMSCVDFK